jgi:hypothetical protein
MRPYLSDRPALPAQEVTRKAHADIESMRNSHTEEMCNAEEGTGVLYFSPEPGKSWNRLTWILNDGP